ncbi:pentapeptide repeat-containing protein [Pikeienuella piscinae]|uniref:Pentapeptide repeat-containing protein n=1 Tax=Pikeienuella piscinae TaxID=2748098 RepID=A0A7L5BWK8_9RHOB|nr:pentapeptide repeat-containing protein [Pikeienuella piscinae]QIE54626.1 pentapeptide repeat-containing protein [Pikeienuella piscinae]
MLSPLWLALFILILWALYTLATTEFSVLSPTDKRWHILAIAAMIASLGGLFSAPLAVFKVQVNERQTKAIEAQRYVAEQGHITDRITKAVEQLGAEKTVYVDGQPATRPNLEVRLGAIYALERIAQDSERDHIPIMETLSAYVRQNISDGPAKAFPLGAYPERDEDADEAAETLRHEMITARRENWREWFESLGPVRRPRDDVAAVLKVFARRTDARRAHELATKPEFHIDLSHANLQRVNLAGADLKRTDLSRAEMEGADLGGAVLKSAHLTSLSGARILPKRKT